MHYFCGLGYLLIVWRNGLAFAYCLVDGGDGACICWILSFLLSSAAQQAKFKAMFMECALLLSTAWDVELGGGVWWPPTEWVQQWPPIAQGPSEGDAGVVSEVTACSRMGINAGLPSASSEVGSCSPCLCLVTGGEVCPSPANSPGTSNVVLVCKWGFCRFNFLSNIDYMKGRERER